MKKYFTKNRGLFCTGPIICFIFKAVKSASEIDFLIVGQGLAGSSVAMRALAAQYRVLVLDEPSKNRSSTVAAGVFNPITGRKMLKTWLADEIFPSLHAYYRSIEVLTKRRFFHPLPLYRPFGTIEMQNAWMGDTGERLAPYIDRLVMPGGFDERVNDPFGGVLLKNAGYLDTNGYLEAVRAYLREHDAFRDTTFDAGKLEVSQDSVRYENIVAKKAVFCQGVGNATNPWFGTIPVNSLKGEFLTVQCDIKKHVILNGGVHMVPDSQAARWRVGSTYERTDKAPGVTTRAREELIRKLNALVCAPYSVEAQQWGVRPTTPDRKPVIGAHPKFKSMVIFNGFGTKGVSLAPYFSDVLIRWMGNTGKMNEEADVTRFY